MSESLRATEAECAAKSVAPRVSLADIERAIVLATYCTGDQVGPRPPADDPGNPLNSLHTLTICLIVLRNGFVVVGKSAPASPENFSLSLGQKLAYEDAVRQIWPLMGYALRDKLAGF